MHELPVMQSILSIVLRHAAMHHVQKVHAIGLSVGTLSDLEEEWMQKYFDHLSAGTVAEGARLKIQWVPAVLACEGCGKQEGGQGRGTSPSQDDRPDPHA